MTALNPLGSSLWRTCCGILLSFPLLAQTQSYTGTLDLDNPNDVFLLNFSLSNPATVRIQSYGYGGSASAPGGKNAAGNAIPGGGFDPYISIFQGSSSSATFLSSNDDGSCPPGTGSPACHDSTFKAVLQPGSYTMALSTFENFSFAENLGAGILADGFIGLGNYFDQQSGVFRQPNYAFDLTIPVVVSSGVSVSQTGFVRNRSTGLWVGTLTVTNTGSAPIGGPIQVVLNNISPTVTMTNNDGTFLGSPVITVSTGALAAGATANVSIQFTNPNNVFINFTPVIYSGGL